MKDLYVIGNGFDIHHGIPSSYKNFRTWMEDNDPELLSRMDEVLGLCTDEWWNEFETNLGEVSAVKNFTEVVAFKNRPDLKSEEFRSGELDNARYEIEDRLGGLISDLKADFHLWASQLPPGDDGEVVLVNREEAFFSDFQLLLDIGGIIWNSSGANSPHTRFGFGQRIYSSRSRPFIWRYSERT